IRLDFRVAPPDLGCYLGRGAAVLVEHDGLVGHDRSPWSPTGSDGPAPVAGSCVSSGPGGSTGLPRRRRGQEADRFAESAARIPRATSKQAQNPALSFSTQAAATCRLGSVVPGIVAQPIFITMSLRL